jgi:prolipoprotein diacylglyceryl transferase
MRPEVIAYLHRHGLTALTVAVPAPGFLYVVVLITACLLYWKRARAVGASTDRIITLCLLAGAATVIGAHVFRTLLTGDWQHLSFFSNSVGGTASWGAYLGGTLAVLGYGRKVGISRLVSLDIIATIQPVGEVIGRIECWLAGDDFGRVTSVPWSIRFPSGSYPWQAHVGRGLIGNDAAWSLPVHPQQFYLMINALLLAFVLSRIWHRFRAHPGQTLALYMMLYGATRFVWEFFRDPAAGGASGMLSVSQWMCLAYIVVGVLLWHMVKNKVASRASTPL